MKNYAFISPGIILRFRNEEVREIIERAKTFRKAASENENCREHDFSFFDYHGENIFWMAYEQEITKDCNLCISVMLAEEYTKIMEENQNVQPENKRRFNTESLQNGEGKEDPDDQSCEQHTGKGNSQIQKAE